MIMDMQWSASNGVRILKIEGRFDNYSAPSVRRWIEAATEKKPPNLVVDLTGVHFVDSTALATLVQGLKRCREFHGDLRLCGMQQPVRMIFELTRLDKAFEIFSAREAAVAAFSNDKAPRAGA